MTSSGDHPASGHRLPGAESELMRLVNAMCEGSATHADVVALEKLLADPSNREFYLAAMELHAALLWRWHAADSATPSGDGAHGAAAPPGARGRAAPSSAVSGRFAAAVGTLRRASLSWMRSLSRPVPFSLFMAATILGITLGTAAVLHVRRDAGSESADAAGRRGTRVATITGLHDVAWAQSAEAHERMAGLVVGDTIEIDRGLVELSYESGALVVIEGPAWYEVRGKASGRLTRGRAAAKTVHPKPRPGEEPRPLFTILTPSSVVHDLGTEFGTEVNGSSGLAAVHVFEGLVELASADRATNPSARFVRLAAGESARMDETGKIIPASRSLRDRFVRSLPSAAPAAPMASVWERIGWNDSTAVTIYHDPLRGSGPLAGTTPASRGGIGDEAWTAPAANWDLTPDGLAISGPDACAWLPVALQPGRLYRLTVEMRASGVDWLAAGLASRPSPQRSIHHCLGDAVWFLQRQNPVTAGINEMFVRVGRSDSKINGDVAGGQVTRTVVLDLRPRARAHFLLDGQLLRSQPLPHGEPLVAAVLSNLDCGGMVRSIRLETSIPDSAIHAEPSLMAQPVEGQLP